VAPAEPEEFAGALLTLAGDPALRRRFGEAGLARQQLRFSADAMADSYVEAFRLALERHSHQNGHAT
jgi:glycosyltransferase involved in cell wall biosynthesis